MDSIRNKKKAAMQLISTGVESIKKNEEEKTEVKKQQNVIHTEEQKAALKPNDVDAKDAHKWLLIEVLC